MQKLIKQLKDNGIIAEVSNNNTSLIIKEPIIMTTLAMHNATEEQIIKHLQAKL